MTIFDEVIVARKSGHELKLFLFFPFICLFKKTKNSKNISACFSEFLFFLFESYRGEDHDENVEWLSYE